MWNDLRTAKKDGFLYLRPAKLNLIIFEPATSNKDTLFLNFWLLWALRRITVMICSIIITIRLTNTTSLLKIEILTYGPRKTRVPLVLLMLHSCQKETKNLLFVFEFFHSSFIDVEQKHSYAIQQMWYLLLNTIMK